MSLYRILLENDNYLIVDKKSGVLIHSDKYEKSNTLMQQMIRDKGFPLYPVHRIDRYTSGVLLVAKTKSAVFYLQSLFLEEKIEKIYLALVSKTLPAKNLKITLSLGRNKNNKLLFTNKNAKNYKNACTKAHVIDKTFVKLILQTGRTHQIRAHLFSIGCPVLNDPIYGKSLDNDPFHQYLHAYSLKFICPFTEKKVYVRSLLPQEFLNKLKELQISFNEEEIEKIGTEDLNNSKKFDA